MCYCIDAGLSMYTSINYLFGSDDRPVVCLAPKQYLKHCWYIVIWTLATNVSQIRVKIQNNSFKKMRLKMYCGPFCLGFYVLRDMDAVGGGFLSIWLLRSLSVSRGGSNSRRSSPGTSDRFLTGTHLSYIMCNLGCGSEPVWVMARHAAFDIFWLGKMFLKCPIIPLSDYRWMKRLEKKRAGFIRVPIKF